MIIKIDIYNNGVKYSVIVVVTQYPVADLRGVGWVVVWVGVERVCVCVWGGGVRVAGTPYFDRPSVDL